jgi:hypothetical protein
MSNYSDEEVNQVAGDFARSFALYVTYHTKISAPDHMIEDDMGYNVASIFEALYKQDPEIASQLFQAMFLYYVHKSGFEGLPPIIVKNKG